MILEKTVILIFSTVPQKELAAVAVPYSSMPLKKTAINCHRLKLWLDPDGGRLKPQKVYMYACMYVCTYTCVCPG